MLSQINEGIRHLLQDGYVVDDKYIALPVLLWGGAQVGGDGTISYPSPLSAANSSRLGSEALLGEPPKNPDKVQIY